MTRSILVLVLGFVAGCGSVMVDDEFDIDDADADDAAAEAVDADDAADAEPADVPVDTPVDTPEADTLDVPVDTAVDVPVDTSVDTSVDTVADAGDGDAAPDGANPDWLCSSCDTVLGPCGGGAGTCYYGKCHINCAAASCPTESVSFHDVVYTWWCQTFEVSVEGPDGGLVPVELSLCTPHCV